MAQSRSHSRRCQRRGRRAGLIRPAARGNCRLDGEPSGVAALVAAALPPAITVTAATLATAATPAASLAATSLAASARR